MMMLDVHYLGNPYCADTTANTYDKQTNRSDGENY